MVGDPRETEPLDEPYLWDRSGPVDPEVAALERVLGTLRADPDRTAPRPRRSRRPFAFRGSLLAAGLVAAAGLLLWFALGGSSPALQLRLASGELLAENEWFTAPADDTHIELDRFGDLTLTEGSRLQVRRLAQEETRLYLDRGRLDAFVNLDARPRFFQVGTPATRCVDLGCKYTLTVDDEGNAEVVVTMGQVAFENEGREVLVPRGATCRASRARGAGTPRYRGAHPDTVVALDAFDAALEPADRRARADHLVGLADVAVPDPQDALWLWHLMRDPDPAVATRVVAVVERRFDRPDGLEAASGVPPTRADAALWKQHLGVGW